MEKTFNMGVGMVAVLPPDDVDRALAMLTARHVPSWVLGSVRRVAAAEPAPGCLLGDPRVHPGTSEPLLLGDGHAAQIVSGVESSPRSMGGAAPWPGRGGRAAPAAADARHAGVGGLEKPGVGVTLRWKLRGSSERRQTAS